MTSTLRLLVCAVALLSLTGCATVRTLDAAKPGAPVVYAGTRLDWYTINGGCCPQIGRASCRERVLRLV